MAGLDYKSCDVCHSKTFYDAGVDYWANASRIAYHVSICDKCAVTHEVSIKNKDTNELVIVEFFPYGKENQV